MICTHNLGFPRIGAQRELKKSLESYWQGEIGAQDLLVKGQKLRASNWRTQANSGLDLVPVGDFSWYDHVLDMSALLGCVPERFNHSGQTVDMDTYFRMARGRSITGGDVNACEMTKWFDTNYHYIVPEFQPEQSFKLSTEKLFDEVQEAQQLGYSVKPVILGPLSFLWLGKAEGGSLIS
jgi:5-methyltetrahydropteroyltriglutamate--homocysteine methyltransferase